MIVPPFAPISPQDHALFWSLESLLRAQIHPIFLVKDSLKATLAGESLTTVPEFMIDFRQLTEDTPQKATLRGFFPDLKIEDKLATFTCRASNFTSSPDRINAPVRIYLVDTRTVETLQFPEMLSCGPNSIDLVFHLQNPLKRWLEIEDSILSPITHSTHADEAPKAPQTAVSGVSSRVVPLGNKTKHFSSKGVAN